MRVLIAPDTFKSSLPADAVAEALARGWLAQRPDDEVVRRPMADGGEGTLDAIVAAVDDARAHVVPEITGPDGRRRDARFVLLPNRVAVLELAETSGLPLMKELDALGATTRGLGELIEVAIQRGAQRVMITLGGSATTDGATGALRALGLELVDDAGVTLPDGGGALERLARFGTSRLKPPPSHGVEVITDVENPLLGPDGAATVFGPQKGATDRDIAVLERGLARLAELTGGNPDAPGAGAAGGAGYGLATFWGATLRPGSEAIAEVVGIPEQLARCDLAITGEGTLDATSLRGKVPGYIADRCREAQRPLAIVAGHVALPPDQWPTERVVSTSILAGSAQRSLAEPARWLEAAGAQLAIDQQNQEPA